MLFCTKLTLFCLLCIRRLQPAVWVSHFHAMQCLNDGLIPVHLQLVSSGKESCHMATHGLTSDHYVV